jgi:hypothetical protein
MKTIRTAALLATALTFSAMAEETIQPPSNEGLLAVIIDDQTGEELATDHGIQPLVLDDLVELVKGVLDACKPATLMHLAVDEEAKDNPVGRLTFVPFTGGKPPHAPSPTLPLRVLSAETEKYRRDRAAWQQGIKLYQKQVVVEAEGFIRQVAATQLKVSERFDKLLEERNGRDFNRSDIVGCITMANQLLGKQGRRVLILNTDANDLPANRAPRKTPLTVTELSGDIELIFVNTSHQPQQSPLFRGIPNKVHGVPSMKAAFVLLVEMLAQESVANKAKPGESAAVAR